VAKILEEFGKGNFKADCKHFENPQASFPAPILQLGDVDSANP